MSYLVKQVTSHLLIILLGLVFILGSSGAKPTLSILGDNPVSIEQGRTYDDAGATATDEAGSSIKVITTGLDELTTSLLGHYAITYTATDINGNTATASRTVKVIKANVSDTTRPIITLLGDATVSITKGSTYIDAGATATDNKDGDITANIITLNPVDTQTIGTYTMTYNVKDAAKNNADQVTRKVTVKSIEAIFDQFNIGFSGPSSFPFASTTEGEKIWLSAKRLVLDDKVEEVAYYQNIKLFDPAAFATLQQHLKKSKFFILWLTENWEESWFNKNSIQAMMDAGYIPVFSYWYFGDKLINGMPDADKKAAYAADNIRVANFLSDLNGKKMLIMEPEFNKKPVLASEATQHEFAGIISGAIDTIKTHNADLLFSLSMMDTGSRGVTNTGSYCGYENCALGDQYAWKKPEIVFNDLMDQLDFISFHQMVGQFSRDPQNLGDWDHPNPIKNTDEAIGIDFLADRIVNFSAFLHQKYNKPVFMPYITVPTATWDDANGNQQIETTEIDANGWTHKANATYKRLSELKQTLKDKGLFGFAPMTLFDNPRHDYPGYQFMMNNEYHLGIISTSATDETDIAPYGDLTFKGDILAHIFSPESLINIAQQFGKASQGNTSGTYSASKALDGDPVSFQSTQCNSTDNWWQVALPNLTHINKIVLHNRAGQTAQLHGAKVHLLLTPYSGTLNNETQIEMLNSHMKQIFSYDSPKEARYLLVKAKDDNCLHLAEVEVYGETP
ncbi:MAG: DUF5011 domain-containing protein [Cocleimonas sp.]|nr:DUF5011 domain-containing protein [Cocleimonas sp.]